MDFGTRKKVEEKKTLMCIKMRLQTTSENQNKNVLWLNGWCNSVDLRFFCRKKNANTKTSEHHSIDTNWWTGMSHSYVVAAFGVAYWSDTVGSWILGETVPFINNEWSHTWYSNCETCANKLTARWRKNDDIAEMKNTRRQHTHTNARTREIKMYRRLDGFNVNRNTLTERWDLYGFANQRVFCHA